MFDLERFSFTEMIRLGSILRKLGDGAGSMEGAADRIVRYLQHHLVSQDGQEACVLVRLFKTHPLGELDDELRQFAVAQLGSVAALPAMKCLTLLATAGERHEWNSRRASKRHRAIPLHSKNAVESSPMISRLLNQLGLSASTFLKPDPTFMMDAGQKTFNVFHVPEAEGSPYVPDQWEFVIPCAVKSALGFGGLLPPDDLFAVIIFSRVAIPRQTAEFFKTLALSTKLAIIPFVEKKVFA